MTVSESLVSPASLGHLPGSLEPLGRSPGGRKGGGWAAAAAFSGQGGPRHPCPPGTARRVFRCLSARAHLRAGADRARLSGATWECGEIGDVGAGARSGPFLCTRVTLRKVLIKPISCLSSSICRAGMKLFSELRKFLTVSLFGTGMNILLYSPCPPPKHITAASFRPCCRLAALVHGSGNSALGRENISLLKKIDGCFPSASCLFH